MSGLVKQLFCLIPDPSLPYAAAATSLTSSLMYQANPICARLSANYFLRNGSCTKDAAISHWQLAISKREERRFSRRFFSPFLAPQARAAKRSGFTPPIYFDKD